jgi:hypothetical protein
VGLLQLVLDGVKNLILKSDRFAKRHEEDHRTNDSDHHGKPEEEQNEHAGYHHLVVPCLG